MNTKNKNKLSIYAVGDTESYHRSFYGGYGMTGPGRNKPYFDNPETLYEPAKLTLKEADIRFGMVCGVYSDRGLTKTTHFTNRGVSMSPEHVSVLTYAGFDVMGIGCNNHLTQGEEAFLDTLDILTKNKIKLVGSGRNIDEARRPVILEQKGTKVGFLHYNSICPPGFEAGLNKPGCAPLRASTHFEGFDWQPGAPPKIISTADKDDLSAMIADIKKLRPLVDVLILSLHWGVRFVPAIIAMYQTEVGHAAIDAGVDLILGHHPHILRGIEVYKGKVIFYSLANFVMPDPSGGKTGPVTLYYLRRDYPDYPDYNWPVDCRKSILAKCLISNKKIEKVSYLPIMINGHAQPEILPYSDKRSSKVFDYMEWCCQDQGIDTNFSREGDEVVVS